jgi:hypothetical protein
VTGQLVAFGDSRNVSTRPADCTWRGGTRREIGASRPLSSFRPDFVHRPGVPFDLADTGQALEWNHLNQPVYVFKYSSGDYEHKKSFHVSERTPGGVWSAERLETDKSPRYLEKGIAVSPGVIAFPIEVPASGATGYRILWYDHGEWSIEDTGFTSSDFFPFRLTTVSPTGELIYRLKPPPDGDSTAAWIARRLMA